MSHEYLFDVKLFATIPVSAPNKKAAFERVRELLDNASANFGADEKGDPILSEVSLDTEDGAELIEIDGEPV